MTFPSDIRATKTGGACVLDRTKLKSLQDLIGPEKAAIALVKFRHALDSELAAIGAESTDVTEKGMRAHKLVGIAGSIGFQELSDKSREFEEAAKQNTADISRYLDELFSAAERARVELDGLPKC
jgi:HPt (histidine-containing phosphotransfer) domain-containing protein